MLDVIVLGPSVRVGVSAPDAAVFASAPAGGAAVSSAPPLPALSSPALPSVSTLVFPGAGAGPAGPEGPQGPAGPEGPAGPTGPQGATGEPGSPGPAGADGDSAYEVAVANGFVGTEGEWVASLEGDVGPQGPAGDTGPPGPQGETGATGATGPAGPEGPIGPTGPSGADGDSAYEVAVANGFVGTESEWVASLEGDVGPQGPIGPEGPAGPKGDKGDPGTTSWDGLTDKPATFPPDAHTHDDRYYTETEADARYSLVSHGHASYETQLADHEARLDELEDVPHFDGYISANVNVPNATWFTIPIDVTAVEGGLTWDATIRRLTVTKGGVYLLKGQVNYATNNSGTRYVSILTGTGDRVAYNATPTASGGSVVAETVRPIRLAAGTTLELQGHQNSGGTLAAVGGAGFTHMTVTRLAT